MYVGVHAPHEAVLTSKCTSLQAEARGPLRAARVLDAAALVMRAVAEGGASAAAPMREAALAEGALLTHLLAALSTQVRSCLRSCTGCESTPRSSGRPYSCSA